MLAKMLNDMLIPDERRDLTSFANIKWLAEHLHKLNAKHKNYPKVSALLTEIIQNNMYLLRKKQGGK